MPMRRCDARLKGTRRQRILVCAWTADPARRARGGSAGEGPCSGGGLRRHARAQRLALAANSEEPLARPQGGRARNVIPETFECNVNYRFAPGKSLEQAQQDVLDAVAGRAEVSFPDLSPSGRVVTRDNPLFDHLLNVTSADVAPKQAWTDVARLTQAGIDAVNFGPGLSSQAHQMDEFVTVDLIEQGYRMFESFLCSAPRSS